MKKIVLLFVLLLLYGINHAQTIDVMFHVPATPFQDADVGAMAFGDIDNDNDQDLVITGKGGPVKTTLYINDGSGNFSEASGTPFVNVYGGTVGFADVNNDDFIDLLITGTTGGGTRTVNLYINNQNGNFATRATPFVPANNGDFAFADIDNDEDNDLIYTGLGATDKFTKLYLNDGSANFSEVVSTPFEALNSSSVRFIDVENDGDEDVILCGQFNTAPFSTNVYSTKLYRNNGNGIFTMDTASSFIGSSSGDLSVADSDNDGDLDILLNGNSPQGLITKLYINNGTGLFTEVAGTPFTGTQVGAAQFADFNNDGKKDVILLGAKTGIPSATAEIYQNQGNNAFILTNTMIATYLGSLAIADVDGDNDLDFIFGGTHFQLPTHSPKMYKNNFSPLGMGNLETTDLVKYYPNPTTDMVSFNMQENFEDIRISNLTGQIVFKQKIKDLDFTMDLSQFSKGTYIAHLSNHRKSIKVKLVKF
jgi:hypothetical protein